MLTFGQQDVAVRKILARRKIDESHSNFDNSYDELLTAVKALDELLDAMNFATEQKDAAP